MSKQQTWRLAETMARKALEQALTRPPDPPHQHEESLRLYLAILQVRTVSCCCLLSLRAAAHGSPAPLEQICKAVCFCGAWLP